MIGPSNGLLPAAPGLSGNHGIRWRGGQNDCRTGLRIDAPVKRLRPFAAGTQPVALGSALILGGATPPAWKTRPPISACASLPRSKPGISTFSTRRVSPPSSTGCRSCPTASSAAISPVRRRSRPSSPTAWRHGSAGGHQFGVSVRRDGVVSRGSAAGTGTRPSRRRSHRLSRRDRPPTPLSEGRESAV